MSYSERQTPLMPRRVGGKSLLRLELLEGRVLLHGGDLAWAGVVDPSNVCLVGGRMDDSQHMDPTSLPAQLVVHGTETMPNPVTTPTASTIDCGNWSNPAIWKNGRVPGPTDDVLITREVLVDTTQAQARAILITANAGLVFDPHRDTALKVGTLVVSDNGLLQIGSAVAPVDPNVTARIVIADQPLDLVKDPKQYLTGLLALDQSTVRIYGANKTTEATQLRLAVEPRAGQTTLTLEHAPAGWRVGDRLALPPTDPVLDKVSATGPTETEEFRVTAISGTVVTLDHPLKNDHRGAYDAKGALTFLPHVIDLSRNVVIRSENPQGTRGHVLLTDMAAVDIRYAEFTDLGRTTGAPLDNTTFGPTGTVTHVGTNQVGRYSLHLHHLMGPHNETGQGYQYTLVGNAISDGLKWGLTIHQTSYGLVQGNDLYDFQTAGIATESGNEAYNVIEQNVVFRVVGGGQELSDGFWFAGPLNYVRNNVAASAFDSAYLGYGFHLDALRVTDPSDQFPLFRGADISRADQSVVLPHGALTFLEFRGNEAYAMDKSLSIDHYAGPGLGGEILISDLRAWGVFDGAAMVYGGLTPVTFDGLTVRKAAYYGFYQTTQSGAVTLRHADIQSPDILAGGVAPTGILFTGGVAVASRLVVEDSYLNNIQNIQIRFGDNGGSGPIFSTTTKDTSIRNVKFDNPAGRPFQAITLTYDLGYPSQVPMVPNRIYVYAFNQVANDDFQLYWKEQAGGAPAPYEGNIGNPGFVKYASPEAGLTNQQVLDKYGRTTGGGIARSTQERAGVVNGYVAPIVPGPAVSAVTAVTNSPTQVTISWTTDRPGDSQVEYGLDTGYLQTNPLYVGPVWDPHLVTIHSLSLPVPIAGALYHFRVRSRDAAGNETVSSDFTFTTASPLDVTPPTVTPAAVTGITTTKATISWDTSKPADVKLEYGPTTAYGSTVVRPWYDRPVSLTDLTPGTVYHYRIVATDARGNVGVSADQTFVTLPGPVVAVTSPAQGGTVAGDTVTLTYTLTGNTGEVDHLRLWLDANSPVGEYHLDGMSGFTGLPVGRHTVTGYLVRPDGWKIPGSDFSVSFTTIAPNTAPVALPLTLSTTTGTPVDVDLRTMAHDAETPVNALTFSVGGAVFGTVQLLADGYTARFTPAAGYAGPASFTFSVTDTAVGPSPALTTGPVVVPVTVSAVPSGPGTPRDGRKSPTAPPAALAAGTDTGPVGAATLFNPDRTPRFTVIPFPGFTGGVRVATGDVNGDGIPDLITGAGPGGPALVKVFDGATGREIMTVDPFDGFTGGVFVAVGDLTGDGVADIVVTPDQGGGPRVVIYHGGDFKRIANFFGIDDSSFRGGVRAAIGDLNHDGWPDLAISAGFGGGPRVVVYDGRTLTGSRTKLVDDFFLFDQSLRNGAYLAIGDLDGDGFGELIGGAGPGGAPRVLALSGKDLLAGKGAGSRAVANFFAGDMGNRSGVRVSVNDLDGDDKADLIVGPGTAAGSKVTAYLGKDLSSGNTSPFATLNPFPNSLDGVFVG